jgi:hypothetical protein
MQGGWALADCIEGPLRAFKRFEGNAQFNDGALCVWCIMCERHQHCNIKVKFQLLNPRGGSAGAGAGASEERRSSVDIPEGMEAVGLPTPNGLTSGAGPALTWSGTYVTKGGGRGTHAGV